MVEAIVGIQLASAKSVSVAHPETPSGNLMPHQNERSAMTGPFVITPFVPMASAPTMFAENEGLPFTYKVVACPPAATHTESPTAIEHVDEYADDI